jgi:hypothetical protein
MIIIIMIIMVCTNCLLFSSEVITITPLIPPVPDSTLAQAGESCEPIHLAGELASGASSVTAPLIQFRVLPERAVQCPHV